MTTVYLLQAEHFSNPGRITKIFASRAAANREAADLVNIMLADTSDDVAGEFEELAGPKPEPCDHTNWDKVMEWLAAVHGEECYLDLEAEEVIGRSFNVEINWNDNQSEEGTYSTTVEAIDAEGAEQQARLEMVQNDNQRRTHLRYGRLISCHEV